MKECILFIICLFFAEKILGINNYRIDDSLFVIAQSVNLRSESKLGSDIILTLEKGAAVVAKQQKLYRDEDFSIGRVENDWSKFVTGRWVKISVGDKVGFMFDAFLSHYNFEDIGANKDCSKRDIFKVPSYERYTRTLCSNGIVIESGLGMEWGIEIYFIPNFSFEEAIYFIKENHIDFEFGDKVWNKNEDEITLSESDGESFLNLKMAKFGTCIVINIESGM